MSCGSAGPNSSAANVAAVSELRILVLEDDEGLLRLLADVLEEEGFIVDACSKSDQAIRMARTNSYDLMVADVRMEGLDGLSALSQVQSYQPDVSGLVVSGYADPVQEGRAGRLGIGELLKKPFELDTFLAKVNEILQDRASRLERRRAFDSILESCRWSTTQLARLLQHRGGDAFAFERLSWLVAEMGQHCGLLGASLERLRAAALMAAWKQGSSGSPAPPQAPPESGRWLSCLDDRWDEKGSEIPLQARLIAVALEASRGDAEGALEQRWPGRFDPQALSALAAAEESAAEVVTPESRGRSSADLLNLARTLFQAGDLAHARAALQEVISQGADSPDGVGALLQLARLEQRCGFTDQARAIARRVPELADAFGPATAARTYLECGRLLGDLGEKQDANFYLSQGQQRFLSLGLLPQAAECVILSRHGQAEPFGNETDIKALQVLFEPRNREVMIPLLDRIVALLLGGVRANPVLARPLARLLVAFPKVSARQIEMATPDCQAAALEVLEKVATRSSERLLAPLLKSVNPALRSRAQKLAGAGLHREDPAPLVTVRSLGALKVYVGEQLIPDKVWKTKKVQFLFARLAEAFPNPVSEDQLIEEFWPGDIEKGRNSLYTATSSVRSALRQGGLGELETVVRGAHGLQIVQNVNIEHDLTHLRAIEAEAQQAARTGRTEEALTGFRRVVALAEGAYLADCYLDWAVRIRDEVEQKRLAACLEIITSAAQHERHKEVVEYAQRAIRIDSCHQEAYRFLMQSLLALRRPEEALRQFEACKAALWRELQLEPPIEMEQLRIRAQMV